MMQSGGGGGFGDPMERDPELVAEDVREGYVGPLSLSISMGSYSPPTEMLTSSLRKYAGRQKRRFVLKKILR